MLRPERMHRATILVSNDEADAVISKLAKAKVLHIIEHEKIRVSETEIDIGRPKPSAESISDALTKTRTMLAKLKEQPGNVSITRDTEKVIGRVQELAQRLVEHEQCIGSIHEARKHAIELQLLLDRIPDTDNPLQTFFEAKHVETFLVERTKESQNLDVVFSAEKDGVLLISLMRSPENSKLLENAGYRTLDISGLKHLHGTIYEARRRLKQRLIVLQHDLTVEEQGIEGLGEHIRFLKIAEEQLAIELVKAQAPLYFGQTEKLTVIQGYVPQSVMHFQDDLDRAVVDIGPAREGPTRLKNPKAMREFEELIKLYTLPRYNEIDPTSIMAITFPIFFGFMLGDIGYGLLLFLIFGMLHHFIPSGRKFFEIIMISAVSTMIFGLLYGEFFGTEHFFGWALHPLIHRVHEVHQMLFIAIGIGATHLNLGLMLGMYNVAQDEGWMHAIIEKGSWILLQVAAVLLAGVYTEMALLDSIRVPALAAWAVLALAIGGIAYTEKLQGLFELPMIFSHMLSYTRLVAIGLASVYLAIVVNDIGGSLVAKGGLAILFGLLVIVIGHTVNLALGLLGPFLHSLRLHYAEFFMKFYAGGGQAFRPFGEVQS